MKVYELLGEVFNCNNNSEIVKNLISEAIKNIEYKIVHEKSIDKTIELKSLHKELGDLKNNCYKLKSRNFNMDINDFKNEVMIGFNEVGEAEYKIMIGIDDQFKPIYK